MLCETTRSGTWPKMPHCFWLRVSAWDAGGGEVLKQRLLFLIRVWHLSGWEVAFCSEVLAEITSGNEKPGNKSPKTLMYGFG